MSDAGLTNGAFYAHFRSKEDLVADVLADQLLATADDLAARLDRADAAAARTDALTLLGTMIGTLQLARALTDRELSDELLARGVQTALKLLDDR